MRTAMLPLLAALLRLSLGAAAVLLVIRFAPGKNTCAKADAYIAKHSGSTDGSYRGTYHFTPPVGWMNDPNGFCYANGVYHLFYQCHPYSAEWGPMHWGHAVSRDLIAWEHLPVALAPDRPYDKKGCWSGSALLHNGKLWLMYTGVDGFGRKTQNLAYSSDGVHFEKYAHNPVLRGKTAAERKDLRDPYLWREGEFFYCLLADRRGPRLYRSGDLTHWQEQAHVSPPIGSDVFECPCLIRQGDTELLIGSPVHCPQRGDEFANRSANVCAAGRLDRISGAFIGSEYREIDRGTDFYAAQAARCADGAVYLIAWMNMWERRQITAELDHGWSGMMTLPRRLELSRGALRQYPPEGLRRYYQNPVSVHTEFKGETSFDGICGRSAALRIRCDLKDASRFTVKLFASGPHYAAITYDRRGQLFQLDVSHARYPTAGRPGDMRQRQFPCRADGSHIEMELFLDRCSVEAFFAGGTATASMLCYNGAEASGIRFDADSPVAVHIEKHDIILP